MPVGQSQTPDAGVSACDPLTFAPTIEFNTHRHNLATADGCEVQALRGLSSNRQITGILAKPAGTVVRLANVGTARIKLQDDDAGSLAANRMLLDGDLDLDMGLIVVLIYSGELQRWMRYQ